VRCLLGFLLLILIELRRTPKLKTLRSFQSLVAPSFRENITQIRRNSGWATMVSNYIHCRGDHNNKQQQFYSHGQS